MNKEIQVFLLQGGKGFDEKMNYFDYNADC